MEPSNFPPKPTPETLAAFASGELTGAEAAAVERALSGDSQLSARAARMHAIVETLRSDDSVAPPERALRGVQQVLRGMLQRAAQGAASKEGPNAESWWAVARRSAAAAMRLVFDSSSPENALGFRSVAGHAESRLLAFEHDALEVELQVESRSFDSGSQRCQLIGQLSADRVAGRRVVAIGADGEVGGWSDTDASGVFVLSLPAGTYDVVIGSDDDAGATATVVRALEVP